MPVSRIASQDALGTSALSTVTATYPGATTAGNLLIATVFMNVGTDTIAITNWTKALTKTATQTSDLFYKLADGTETTVTASGGASNSRIHIYEYTGNANPIVTDGSNTSAPASGSTATGPTVTTTNANDLLFGFFGLTGTVTAPSATAPFNLRQIDATIRLIDVDQIVSATNTYSATISWTGTQSSAAGLIAFQAAAAAAPANPQTFNNYQFVKVGDGMSTGEKIK